MFATSRTPLVLAAIAAACASAFAGRPSLVERLGLPPDARVVILNGDDLGMAQAVDAATFRGLDAGGLSSATVMVPCPWFPEVARRAASEPRPNLGVHLTLTSEWETYRWGPVLGASAVPSLVDASGHFWPSFMALYAHAAPAEVELECRAQIDRALAAKIDVTHIDTHMGALHFDVKMHELYLRLAKEYRLPCRMAGEKLLAKIGGTSLLSLADELGVVHSDDFEYVAPPEGEDFGRFWIGQLEKIEKGKVVDFALHCGDATPELRAAIGGDDREPAARLVVSERWREALKSKGLYVISYRELRALQRGEKKPAAAK